MKATPEEMVRELESFAAEWQKEGDALHNEPEYDGGYGDALLRCSGNLRALILVLTGHDGLEQPCEGKQDGNGN